MPKDIDLQDLIKIVTEIQERDRQKKVNYENKIVINIDNVEKEFNQKNSIREKILVLKNFERNYLLNNFDENRYLNLFYLEAKMLSKINYHHNFEYQQPKKIKQLEFTEPFQGFYDLSPVRIEKYLGYKSSIIDGIVLYYDMQFILLLIYEIFLGIGVRDEYDGFDLLFFILNYFVNDALWVKDFTLRVTFEYITLYQLDVTKTKSSKLYKDFLDNSLVFSNKEIFYKKYDTKAYQILVEKLYHNYYINHCRYNDYTSEEKAEQITIFGNVIKKLDNYLNKTKSDKQLNDLLFTKTEIIKEQAIRVDNDKRNKEETIRLYENYEINFKNEKNKSYLTYYEYRSSLENEKLIKYILSEIEYDYLKYKMITKKMKRRLIDILVTEINNLSLKQIINQIIRTEIEGTSRENFVVDYSKLDNIRKVSNEVSEKLITEFDLEPEVVLTKEEVIQTENEWLTFYQNLTESAKELLKKIFQNQSVEELNRFSLKEGELLEVIIDRINNEANQYIGDNIIEIGEEIYIYEEYLNEIKKIIGGN